MFAGTFLGAMACHVFRRMSTEGIHTHIPTLVITSYRQGDQRPAVCDLVDEEEEDDDEDDDDKTPRSHSLPVLWFICKAGHLQFPGRLLCK